MSRISIIIITLIVCFGIALTVTKLAAAAYWGGMTGYQNYTINYNPRQSGNGGEIQKLYDHDEGVLCYIYVGHNVSCIKD